MIKRLFFEKSGEMQYLSHRDFLRFLERLFKIAGVPILYSKGFHPRPRMSFGSPISIGEEAFYEPFDLHLKINLDNVELINKLYSKSPKRFRVFESCDIDGRTSIVSSFNALLYHIEFDKSNEKELFINLLNNEKIIETRIKNGIKKCRDLKVNLVSLKDFGDYVEIILNNISPNAFIRMVELDQKYIKIKRIKYLNI